MEPKYHSQLLENAVEHLSGLPGIGRKTALRLALYMLRQDVSFANLLSVSIADLRNNVVYCRICHNISDNEVCPICASAKRDKGTICVVENIRDIMAIEATQQYFGVYHVLGGVISPMDGIGPSDIEIDSLVERVKSGDVSEVILALSTTMEGDTTNFYIYRKLEGTGVKLTTIARGVSIGDELEYTDEVTLGRSIINRTTFEGK